jgi:hypothetical protein
MNLPMAEWTPQTAEEYWSAEPVDFIEIVFPGPVKVLKQHI